MALLTLPVPFSSPSLLAHSGTSHLQHLKRLLIHLSLRPFAKIFVHPTGYILVLAITHELAMGMGPSTRAKYERSRADFCERPTVQRMRLSMMRTGRLASREKADRLMPGLTRLIITGVLELMG